MTFSKDGKQYQLQGINLTPAKVKVISKSNMSKLLQHRPIPTYALHVHTKDTGPSCASNLAMVDISIKEDIALEIAHLLNEFQFLFDKPEELPPQRLQDH